MGKINSKKIIHDIHELEEKNELCIISKNATDILTDDILEDRRINYHLIEPKKEWLNSHLFFADSVQQYNEVYRNNIVDLLSDLDSNMFINLNKICFVRSVNDIPQVCKEVGSGMGIGEGIEEFEFPSIIEFQDDEDIDSEEIEDSALGCHWHMYNSIIVNIDSISRTLDKMEQEYSGFNDFNREKEEGIAIYTTLIHEIRHLGLANPLLDNKEYPSELDSEQNVEDWAINEFEKWVYGDNEDIFLNKIVNEISEKETSR